MGLILLLNIPLLFTPIIIYAVYKIITKPSDGQLDNNNNIRDITKIKDDTQRKDIPNITFSTKPLVNPLDEKALATNPTRVSTEEKASDAAVCDASMGKEPPIGEQIPMDEAFFSMKDFLSNRDYFTTISNSIHRRSWEILTERILEDLDATPSAEDLSELVNEIYNCEQNGGELGKIRLLKFVKNRHTHAGFIQDLIKKYTDGSFRSTLNELAYKAVSTLNLKDTIKKFNEMSAFYNTYTESTERKKEMLQQLDKANQTLLLLIKTKLESSNFSYKKIYEELIEFQVHPEKNIQFENRIFERPDYTKLINLVMRLQLINPNTNFSLSFECKENKIAFSKISIGNAANFSIEKSQNCLNEFVTEAGYKKWKDKNFFVMMDIIFEYKICH